MADFGEAVEELSRDVDIMNATKADTASVADYIKDNKEQIFDPISAKLGGDFDVQNVDGKYTATLEGKPVDLEASKAALDNGDVIESMKQLGADDKVLNSREIQQYAKEYKDAWSKQPSVQDKISLDNSISKGEEFKKSYGEPTDADDFQEKQDKNPELKKTVENAKSDLEEKAKSGKPVEVGKWVKRTLKGLGVVISMAALYGLIKEHQNAMNGCWLIHNGDGTKCKLDLLTCSSDARNATPDKLCANGDYQTCTNACTLQKNVSCFADPTCLTCNADKTCKTKLTQCTGDDPPCDPTVCNSSAPFCPDGYTLRCVNVSFWGAAGDLLPQLVDGPGNIISKIISVLVKILIIIGIVIGAFILFKLGFYVYTNWKTKKSSYYYA